MKLNINKPLVIFDLESTGLDLVNDRIIQISYIKVMPSGEEIRESFNVNPGKPIPELVTQLTGISDAGVADAPCFKQLAATLAAKFKGCDFAGFNSNHFDVPMLAEEFLRAGIDFTFLIADSLMRKPFFIRWKSQFGSCLQVLLWTKDGGRL